MTSAQNILMKKHGTPSEFSQAVWKAYDHMVITMTEALAGIQKYNVDWAKAGTEKDGASGSTGNGG